MPLYDLSISKLGKPQYDSPLDQLLCKHSTSAHYVSDSRKVAFDINAGSESFCDTSQFLEVGGPRSKLFFDPKKTTAAVVTCGGICPGINDVIRALVMTAHYRYGIPKILGIKYGYEGFIKKYNHAPIELTPDKVTHIHKIGGTILGTSRGTQDKNKVVDFLESNQVNLLFVIGGDGTQRGALEIAQKVEARGLEISIIGIPKTIDNDILHMDSTFGFSTAVSEAVKAIDIVNTEANSHTAGIGLVKLMGRHSGFITALASMAMSDANFVLIPEVPFDLEGENGFYAHLKKRLERKNHAVIVVSEGAGQNFFEGTMEYDKSGNEKFKDIGLFLKAGIQDYFKKQSMPVNLKYVDPSYSIRAIAANATDSVYCQRLGQHAVHAAMSGRTKMVVGMRHNRYVHFPMEMIAAGRRQVDPASPLWLSVLESTGQCPEMVNS